MREFTTTRAHGIWSYALHVAVRELIPREGHCSCRQGVLRVLFVVKLVKGPWLACVVR